MNVLMLSPGFPYEMPSHTRGLHQVGAKVYGLGDQPPPALPQEARESLFDYRQVASLWDEDEVIALVKNWLGGTRLQHVVCQWETAMLLAARLREEFDIPGLTVEQTVPFRDKEIMKQQLDAAGIRTPRHSRATTLEEVQAGAKKVGFPLIIKPISGAGSVDTYRIDNEEELQEVLPALRGIDQVSVEEFIQGEEYTFDTVCINGEIAYHNVCWYRPNPLISKQNEWISPQTFIFRDPDQELLAPGVALGKQVIEALGVQTGFTHMEWFLTSKGEAVFGEIGARPPGAKTVDLMNYSCDIDLFTGCAEAICHGRFTQDVQRSYNSSMVFKRAQGEGVIHRIDGLDRILGRYGEHIAAVELLPIGSPRRNFQQTVLADGFIVVRHPDLEATMEMADRIGTDVQLYAS